VETADVLVFDEVEEASGDPVLWGEGRRYLFGGRGEGDAPFPDAVAVGGGVGAADDVCAVSAVEGGGSRLDVGQ
jgi:hypothetical protein